MNLENLLVVLVIVLVTFFNVILPWLRKQLEDEQTGDAGAELQEALPTAMGPMPAATPEPETRRHAPLSAMMPLAVTTTPAAARPARRSPLGRHSDVRDAIVLMAILGPGRAQQPFV